MRTEADGDSVHSTLDDFVVSAEARVDDLLLVAGLAARRPFHVLGGDASAVVDGPSGKRFESVEFTRMRRREPAGRRSFNDLQVEGERFLDFLGSAMDVLSSDPQAEFIRLALSAYLTSLHRAFDTQQFLSLCVVVEALKERHARSHGWHKMLSKKQKAEVTEHVRQGLVAAARAGHLAGPPHVEAREKIPELFRPRIRTVLNDLVAEAGIDVSDLFHRDKRTGPRGPFDFDFLTVRNRLVHQGKPPENLLQFHNVIVRTQYFVERLLFTALGYPPRGFLKLHYGVDKPPTR